MTAIAYRSGQMAADTGVHQGDEIPYHIKKIYRINGKLVAASGNIADMMGFRDWIRQGANGDFVRLEVERAGFNGIVVEPDGTVLCMHEYGPLFRYDAPFFAIGFPKAMMIGAMAAGATAEQAVKIALAYSEGCAGGVQVENLRDDTLDANLGKIIGGPAPLAA
jgi:hypothetical protein